MSSTLVGDRPENGEYLGRTGLVVGGLFGVRVADGIYLTASPGYEERGTRVGIAVPGADEPVDSLGLAFRYATLPLGARVLTGDRRFFVASTVTLGYLLDSSFDNGTDFEDVTAAMNRFDVAVTFAFGGRIPLGSQTLSLQVIYGQSVRNLTDEKLQPRDWEFPPRFKLRGLGLQAGVEFPLGGVG